MIGCFVMIFEKYPPLSRPAFLVVTSSDEPSLANSLQIVEKYFK